MLTLWRALRTPATHYLIINHHNLRLYTLTAGWRTYRVTHRIIRRHHSPLLSEQHLHTPAAITHLLDQHLPTRGRHKYGLIIGLPGTINATLITLQLLSLCHKLNIWVYTITTTRLLSPQEKAFSSSALAASTCLLAPQPNTPLKTASKIATAWRTLFLGGIGIVLSTLAAHAGILYHLRTQHQHLMTASRALPPSPPRSIRVRPLLMLRLLLADGVHIKRLTYKKKLVVILQAPCPDALARTVTLFTQAWGPRAVTTGAVKMVPHAPVLYEQRITVGCAALK